ncbi:hypothetical protein TELCIR_12292 [Teladorsagia circumcincta]|uniref:Uncharacterized protein n=1 Tax=Teladorsagia circumcincta TaxID=45464 RepID=A0A2G9U6Y0_TELCI|nr:hypothetical protein TELCIR_12292 [Teladorsagia circumcincta]
MWRGSDASGDGSGMTFHGYQRVDSDPNLSDNQRATLLNENDDFASTYHAGIDLDESSFDEIERQELRDHLGEIPETFHRRQRREALFGPSVARGGYADAYESSQLLDSCHEKGGHDDTDQSDDSKEEEEEEEEQGGAKKKLRFVRNARELRCCTDSFSRVVYDELPGIKLRLGSAQMNQAEY